MSEDEYTGPQPLWEKLVWGTIILYLVVVLIVFWIFGFSRLPFPL